MRLGQTSIIFFVAKIVGSAIGFLGTIYFARVLGEEILGHYALVLSIVMWLSVVGRIGFTGAITKRISEGSDQEEYATAGAITIIAIGIVVSITVVSFQGYVNVYVGRQVALFTAAIILVVLSSHYIHAALKGYHLVHVSAILSTAKMSVRSLIQISLVMIGFRLTGLLIGYVASAAVFTLIGLAVLRFRPAKPRKEHFNSLFDFAKFSWLGNMRGKTFDQVDIIVLGFFVQAGLIGVYSVAWSLSKFLDIFSSAISTTLFPEMSEIAAQNDPESVSGLAEDALTFAGLIAIPGFVGGTLLADRIMRIYGEAFVVGETVLPILIAAFLVYTYTRQLLNTLNAIDRPDLTFRANGAFIVSNIGLNTLLIWQFGWVGAAVATALSAVIGLCFAYVYLRQLVPFKIPVTEIAQQWAAAIVMGIVISGGLWLENTYHVLTQNFATVLVLVVTGTTVYFTTLLLISNIFRTTVMNNMPSNIPFVTS